MRASTADLRATGAAVLLLAAAFALPGPRWPAELPMVLLLLLAAPGRTSRGAVVGLATAAMALCLADLGTDAALQRPFNPALDAGLAASGWEFARGALGLPALLAAATVAGLAMVAFVAGLWWATGRMAAVLPAYRRPLLIAAMIPALALALVPGSALRLLAARTQDTVAARADLAAFQAAAASDPYADAPAGTLGALAGTDILLIFVESYGISALTDPFLAPPVTAALADGGRLLSDAGLAARSGRVTSPVTGGQSWLPRATFTAGLAVDSQARYAALLASPRRTLLHVARAAGWQTAAVVPAITRAWPEGDFFGYDRILAAGDLGYRGAPFNWVTMPDQFTLAATGRLLLSPGPRPPVMAEIALISSHAPWTPIPPLLPWDAVGDGSVFTPYAAAGDPPDVVWRDPARVRDQYRQSVAASLRVVMEFLARRDRPTLAVVLGDHQPAPFVSGDGPNREVPVHVIGTPAALARLDAWGWDAGLGAAAAPAWPMQDFRDRFLAAFAAPSDVAAADSPAGPDRSDRPASLPPALQR